MIADSLVDLIGNTPMVKLGRIGASLPCPLVVKLETTNPGGSSKDRPALEMILAAGAAVGMSARLAVIAVKK